jgi:hypothetical protein
MPFNSSVSQLVRGISGSSCCFPSLFFQALLEVWFEHQGFSQLTIYLTKLLKGNLSTWSPRCSIFLTFLGSEMNKGFHESMFFKRNFCLQPMCDHPKEDIEKVMIIPREVQPNRAINQI